MTAHAVKFGERSALDRQTAAEIRSIIARQGITQADLAARMGQTRVWVSRRIGSNPGRPVAINLDELEDFARALDVPWWQLLPRLDSNQQPAGNRATTSIDRYRAATRYGVRRGHLRSVRTAA